MRIWRDAVTRRRDVTAWRDMTPWRDGVMWRRNVKPWRRDVTRWCDMIMCTWRRDVTKKIGNLHYIISEWHKRHCDCDNMSYCYCDDIVTTWATVTADYQSYTSDKSIPSKPTDQLWRYCYKAIPTVSAWGVCWCFAMLHIAEQGRWAWVGKILGGL